MIVEASTGQPRPALTLMDMIGPAAEYRAFLSERSAAFGAALDDFEQASGAGDTAAADKARHDAAALLPALRPATAGDAEMEGLFGKVEAALTGNESAPSGELRPMAEAFRTALSQRTILPDTMLAGAAMLLSSQDGETVSPEAVAAASHIAQLLLPLTARIDPDLATRTRAVLVSLPDDAKPGGAIRALGEDLSAMRRALALPEAERKS